MKRQKSDGSKYGQALLSLVDNNSCDDGRTECSTPAARSSENAYVQTAGKAQTQSGPDIANPAGRQAARTGSCLWLCLYFPQLALEVVDGGEFALVYHEYKGQCVVYRAAPAVMNAGVSPGLTLEAARVLCPSLRAIARDRQAENNQMQALADWVYQYSPELSIVNNDTLVLEVAASRRLFNGLESLCGQMEEQLQARWLLKCQMAVSPTPLASLLLAACGENQADSVLPAPLVIVKQQSMLRSVLGRLPVASLLSLSSSEPQAIYRPDQRGHKKPAPFGPRDIKNLLSMGVTRLSDLWRLPRADLSTRFGSEAVACLERLLGEAVDLQSLYQPGLRFMQVMELPLEVKSSRLVLQALEVLVGELVNFLRCKDAASDELIIILCHAGSQKQQSEIRLHLSQCVRDKKHMMQLLCERFTRVVLKAPVIAVRLEVENIEPYRTESAELFAGAEGNAKEAANDNNNTPAWLSLREQLQARLGENVLKQLIAVSDYRPEKAWRFCQNNAIHNTRRSRDACQTTPGNYQLIRPLWLLAKAVRLVFGQQQIELLHGPERIENGWWDGNDIRRDYYIARDQSGARLWVYCDLKQKSKWYIHGLFA